MKNLDQLVEECKNDALSLGIKLGIIEKVTVNTRFTRKWGCCTYKHKTNTYYIEIAASIMNDDVSDMAAKNTIMHEILHALDGGVGLKHTGEWLKAAQLVNDIYGYNVKRCTSAEEKGIEVRQRTPKYVIRCMHCDVRIPYYKRTKIVAWLEGRYGNNNRYRCGRCRSFDLLLYKDGMN